MANPALQGPERYGRMGTYRASSAPTTPSLFEEDTTPTHAEQMTRFGERTGHKVNLHMTEKRFSWQKHTDKPDVLYKLPTTLSPIGAPFGTSTRSDWECTRLNKRDSYNPNAGPGSYHVHDEKRILSTVRNTRGGTFEQTVRQGMGLRTLGPGPAYDLTGVYGRGRDCRIPISFNKDQRKPLADNTRSRTDAMYSPKLPPGRSACFSKSTRLRSLSTTTPGPIYDLSTLNFRTGPAHTFGISKAPRFAAAPGL